MVNCQFMLGMQHENAIVEDDMCRCQHFRNEPELALSRLAVQCLDYIIVLVPRHRSCVEEAND